MTDHKYTVEFRISGKTLDPQEVTKKLLLPPCVVRIPAPEGTPLRESRTGMWGYDGTDGSEIVEWNTLEEGLSFVLDRLWPLRDLLAEYRANCNVVWWCGHFQAGLNGGPLLSPALLKRLGEFGVDLYIDNYFSPPANAEAPEP